MTAKHKKNSPGRAKRILAAFAAAAQCLLPAAAAASGGLSGDVTGDGRVTAEDARLALRRAVNLESYRKDDRRFIACDVTADGQVILDAPGHVFMSPDGHGGLLAALKRSGALADMKKRGIRSVFFFQVDNPLVEIADEAFIGYHVLEKSEYTLKLCAKRDPYEKVGMPMKFGNTFKMVEYTEMTDEQCNRKGKDGRLYFLYGSPAIHVFDRAFLEREALKPMPLHLAHKKIAQVDEKGRVVKPSEPNGYKFEKFIFDILPDAKKAAFLAFDQKDEFSPVKNAEGSDSPATCKADLQAKWRRQLAAHGILIEGSATIEVDPAGL